MTKVNLGKRGWQGDQHCVYCPELESVDHLLVTCPVAHSIWSWIATFNNFVFYSTTVGQLWELDYCIPLKDANLVKMIRGAVLWSLWLDRNRIVFRNGNILNIQALGSKIISLAFFWASQQKTDLTEQLKLIMPCDVKDLLGTTLAISMGDIQVTILTNGGGTTLDDNAELQMVPWELMEDGGS